MYWVHVSRLRIFIHLRIIQLYWHVYVKNRNYIFDIFYFPFHLWLQCTHILFFVIFEALTPDPVYYKYENHTLLSMTTVMPAQQPKPCKWTCELTSDRGYVVYSALGSFYIPMFVMLFFYWRIYRAAVRTTRAINQGFKTTKGKYLNKNSHKLTRKKSNWSAKKQVFLLTLFFSLLLLLSFHIVPLHIFTQSKPGKVTHPLYFHKSMIRIKHLFEWALTPHLHHQKQILKDLKN